MDVPSAFSAFPLENESQQDFWLQLLQKSSKIFITSPLEP
jgi:hypothetical protein